MEELDGPALSLEGLGKRYRTGRSSVVVPVPLLGSRLYVSHGPGADDVEDDDAADDDDQEEEEPRPTGEEREVWALRDVSLSVPRGSALGVIGGNGSGKSTLLKVLGRTTPPTAGRVAVGGRIAPVLGSLSSLVVPDVTLEKNVVLIGRFFGVPHREIAERVPDILRFAELEEHADRKVRHCSSGMVERLAFAIGLHVGVDVLLADERVVTGDREFRERCMARIKQLRRDGVTLVFASHRLELVKDLCSHAVWLDRGRVRAHGPAGEVVDAYAASLAADAEVSAGATADGGKPLTAGARAVEIEQTRLVTPDGEPASTVTSGEAVVAEIECQVREPGVTIVAWLGFRDPAGERRRFVQPQPHTAKEPGLHVIRAKLRLARLPEGECVGRVRLLVNGPQGRTSDLLRARAFQFAIVRDTSDATDAELEEGAMVEWTVTTLPDNDMVALD